jgi:hypothetical protein
VSIPDVEQETGPQAKEQSHPVSVSSVQVPQEVVVELHREAAAAAYPSEVEVVATPEE